MTDNFFCTRHGWKIVGGDTMRMVVLRPQIPDVAASRVYGFSMEHPAGNPRVGAAAPWCSPTLVALYFASRMGSLWSKALRDKRSRDGLCQESRDAPWNIRLAIRVLERLHRGAALHLWHVQKGRRPCTVVSRGLSSPRKGIDPNGQPRRG